MLYFGLRPPSADVHGHTQSIRFNCVMSRRFSLVYVWSNYRASVLFCSGHGKVIMCHVMESDEAHSSLFVVWPIPQCLDLANVLLPNSLWATDLGSLFNQCRSAAANGRRAASVLLS